MEFLATMIFRVQDKKVILDMKSPPWALKEGRNPSAVRMK